MLKSKGTTSGAEQDEFEMEDGEQGSPQEGEEERKNGTKRQLSPDNEVGQTRRDVSI